VAEIAAPRRVFCVYEHRYGSRAVADAALEGRFIIQGIPLRLGLEPDWLGAVLPADKEWRLEWSKFYYGLDLATAFEQTGNLAYVTAWQRLVRSWIARVPVEHDPSDVVGRRIQNWIYAWTRFAARVNLDTLSRDFSRRIAASLDAQLAHLECNLTRERNHRTLELYALFVAALALPDLDPGGARLRYAIAELHRNLLHDILPDGVQRERSTHYHHVVLRSLVGARENMRRYGVPVPPGFDDRLERAVEFALHCHRPDGTIPALSDSDGGSYLDLLALAGDLLDRPDFVYVATRGAAGNPPSSRFASFADGGYYVQRSGWGDGARALTDERYLIFDCGPLGDGGHGHYDALNVEIAANGVPLVVDPGRYTYCDDAPHWRRWFKSTAAHNTVSVDGLDQTPYRRGKPKGPVAQARLRQRATRRGLDLLWGEAVSPLYEVTHRRRVFFVGDEYWLIEDRLDGIGRHRYDLRFHLAPDPDSSLSLRSRDGYSVARTSSVLVAVAGEACPSIERGWISEHYAIKHEAPVLVFTQCAIEHAAFVTLVAPVPTARVHEPELRVQFDRGVACADVRCDGPGGLHDRIIWTIDGSMQPLGGGPLAIASWTRIDYAFGRQETVALSDRDVTIAAETMAEIAEAQS
jgi:heparinase II/III-like protein